MKYGTVLRFLALSPILALAVTSGTVQAQEKGSSSSGTTSDTISKPLSKKDLAKKRKALEKELAGPWKKWMNEDVAYIITDEERQPSSVCRPTKSASSSSSSSGCGAIPRRTPTRTNSRKSTTAASRTPTSTYASGIPGWKTDRGRIYIKYGPAGRNRIPSLGRHL